MLTLNLAKEIGRDPPNKKEMEETMKKFDKNNDGKLNMEEFKEYVKVTFK